MTDPTVTVDHMRRALLCSRGARAWAQRYGLDWNTFIRQGLPASQFEATGDHYGLTVARFAREELENGRR